jgi:hypothetical protein
VGEHLALRWGLRTPDWTQRAVHFALEEPHFLPDARALRGLIIVESPPAFRARFIFTRVEPLARARFPRDAPRTFEVPSNHRSCSVIRFCGGWPPPRRSR